MKKKNIEKDYEFTEDGNLIINMVVNDDSNFLSVFCNDNTPIISEEVSAFLEASTQSIPHKQPLALKVHSDCIDEKEKILYKHGIKKYYEDRSIATKRELHRNVWIAVILAVMGICTLILAHTIEFFFNSIIWAETIDIVAWVFLWESVDILAFKIHALQLNSRRYSAFCSMPIEYVSL